MIWIMVPLWSGVADWFPYPFLLLKISTYLYKKPSPFFPACHTTSATPVKTGYEKPWIDSPAENKMGLQLASKRWQNRKSLVPVNIFEGCWFLKPCIKHLTVWVTLSSKNPGFRLLFRVLPIDDRAELLLAMKHRHLFSERLTSCTFGPLQTHHLLITGEALEGNENIEGCWELSSGSTHNNSIIISIVIIKYDS